MGPSIAFAGKPFNPYINSGALMSAALILKLVRPDLKDMGGDSIENTISLSLGLLLLTIIKLRQTGTYF